MLQTVRYLFSMMLIVFAVNFNTNAGSYFTGELDFYGHEVQLGYDLRISSLELNELDQSSLEYKASVLRNNNLKRTAFELKQLKKAFGLDDIGLTLLVNQFIENTFGEKKDNESVFVKYLILKQLGYDVILTRTGKKLNCMANLSFNPGRYLYIQYNRKTYKDLDFTKRSSGGKHFIFMDDSRSYRTFSQNPMVLPRINAITSARDIEFRHGGVNYEIETVSNKSLIDYLKDLPMHGLGNMYTKQSMSNEMKGSLIKYLKRMTQHMTKAEKAHFLLAFVQQVVPYGSDYSKYGEERYYYPEQTVMAKTADCEDKTFLLSYLAKEVAGVSSVALYFEHDEHLSIGLQIPNYEDSYSFKYAGKSYVACEPTAQLPRLGYSGISLKRVTKVTPL
ncbi:MAG: hypothetical protein JXR19_01600 [Bacteroidia bacterium]